MTPSEYKTLKQAAVLPESCTKFGIFTLSISCLNPLWVNKENFLLLCCTILGIVTEVFNYEPKFDDCIVC
jgi:hypothetical protein